MIFTTVLSPLGSSLGGSVLGAHQGVRCFAFNKKVPGFKTQCPSRSAALKSWALAWWEDGSGVGLSGKTEELGGASCAVECVWCVVYMCVVCMC